jgi:hypothetical protein
MDTSTLLTPGDTAPHTPPPGAAATGTPGRTHRSATGLGAEVRESLLLLGFAVVTTVGLTAAAQAALTLLG